MLCACSVESFALRERLRLGEVKIAILESHHIEEASGRIVGGGKPVRGTDYPGADVRAFFRGNATRKERAARGINGCGPVQLLHERSRAQKLSISSIENIEKTVSVGLKKQTTFGAVFFPVH